MVYSMEFTFFTQQTVILLQPFVYQVNFVNSVDMCSTNEVTKTGYVFKKCEKIFFFLVFEEITFQHFLFINNTKSRFFSFFSDHADIKK